MGHPQFVRSTARTECGFSLIEIIVAIGILSILLGTAASYIRPRVFDLDAAANELLSSLRVSRSRAISRGVRYRVTIPSSSTYQVERLKEVAGVWVTDETETRLVELPATVLVLTGVASTIEINTRGLLVQPVDLLLLTLQDSVNGQTRTVEVWPSGQFNER
jgi:prepilin-type N-terminal cleavage/methylation domain-containing protein